MSKKKTTSPLSGSIAGSSIYTGNAVNQPTTITTTGTTTTQWYNYQSAYAHSPAYFDLYEQDGNLFWKNSKGEIFKLTFTKQETVKQIIDDL